MELAAEDKENSPNRHANIDEIVGDSTRKTGLAVSPTSRSDGVTRIITPAKRGSTLPGGKLITMTVTLTIQDITPEDINSNPKMQRLLCEAVAKATGISSDLVVLKAANVHKEKEPYIGEASDVDFFITAAMNLFAVDADPFDQILAMLKGDPFLAPTDPSVSDEGEDGIGAAIRRVKSEAHRASGLGLRQSSGLRSKSIGGLQRSRSRSGSAIRPTIIINQNADLSMVSVNDSMHASVRSLHGDLQLDEEQSYAYTNKEDPSTDEKQRKEREEFRKRLALESKQTANKLKKMEWNVGDGKPSGALSAAAQDAKKVIAGAQPVFPHKASGGASKYNASTASSSFAGYAGRFLRAQQPKVETLIPKTTAVAKVAKTPVNRRNSDVAKKSSPMLTSPVFSYNPATTPRPTSKNSSPTVESIVADITASSPIRSLILKQELGLDDDLIKILLADEVRRVSVARARVIRELTTILMQYKGGRKKRSQSCGGVSRYNGASDISMELSSPLGTPTQYVAPTELGGNRGRKSMNESLDLEHFIGIKTGSYSSPCSESEQERSLAERQANQELESRLELISSSTLLQENRRLQFEKDKAEADHLEAIRAEKERSENARLDAIKQEQLRAEKEREALLRAEKERADLALKEAVRVEQQKAEELRLEAHRIEREAAIAAAAQQAERERMEAIHQESLRAEQIRAEQERSEAIRQERVRADAAREEAVRVELEKAQVLRLQLEVEKREEVERIAAEKAEKERLLLLEQARFEAIQLELQKAEAAREEVKQAKQEALRVEQEKAEAQRIQLEQQKKEEERKVSEKLEEDRLQAAKREAAIVSLSMMEEEARELALQLQKETSSRLRTLTASSNGQDFERRKRSMQQERTVAEESEKAAVKSIEDALLREKETEDMRRKLQLEAAQRIADDQTRLESDALAEAERLLSLKKQVQARLRHKEIARQEEVLKKKIETAASPADEEITSEIALVDEVVSAPEVSALPSTPLTTPSQSHFGFAKIACFVIACFLLSAGVFKASYERMRVPDNKGFELIAVAAPESMAHEAALNFVDINDVPYTGALFSEMETCFSSPAQFSTIDDAVLQSEYDETYTVPEDSIESTISPSLVEMAVVKSSGQGARWYLLFLAKLPFRIVKHTVLIFFGLA